MSMKIHSDDYPKYTFIDYGTEYFYSYDNRTEIEKIDHTIHKDGSIVIDVHAPAETIPWIYASEIPVEIQFSNKTILFDGKPHIMEVIQHGGDLNSIYKVEVLSPRYTVQ